jgi:hypothetical protein
MLTHPLDTYLLHNQKGGPVLNHYPDFDQHNFDQHNFNQHNVLPIAMGVARIAIVMPCPVSVVK